MPPGCPEPPIVVGRLAPSPTGGLHVGHARTFLVAWLSARAKGGRVALRVEDIDAGRSRPEAARSAIDDLAWLGLDHDGSIVVQSERMAAYRDVLIDLKSSESVYPCTCTRAEVERAASAPHAEDEGPTYPGTCSGRTVADAAAIGDRPFAWRFRVGPGPLAWDDLFAGSTTMEPARVGGDFVVARSPFAPSYQLAVVADDAASEITEVIRGADLIPSTPRQILIARALGLVSPRYGHLPLVVGPDYKRLAKRDGSIKLAALREAGVDPRVLIGWVARSCGWSDRIEPTSPADWVARYDRTTIPPGPCRFDPADIDQATTSK